MAITRDLVDTSRIRRTMRVLPYEEAKEASLRPIYRASSELEKRYVWVAAPGVGCNFRRDRDCSRPGYPRAQIAKLLLRGIAKY